jgi:hypothetical protein
VSVLDDIRQAEREVAAAQLALEVVVGRWLTGFGERGELVGAYWKLQAKRGALRNAEDRRGELDRVHEQRQPVAGPPAGYADARCGHGSHFSWAPVSYRWHVDRVPGCACPEPPPYAVPRVAGLTT